MVFSCFIVSFKIGREVVVRRIKQYIEVPTYSRKEESLRYFLSQNFDVLFARREKPQARSKVAPIHNYSPVRAHAQPSGWGRWNIALKTGIAGLKKGIAAVHRVEKSSRGEPAEAKLRPIGTANRERE